MNSKMAPGNIGIAYLGLLIAIVSSAGCSLTNRDSLGVARCAAIVDKSVASHLVTIGLPVETNSKHFQAFRCHEKETARILQKCLDKEDSCHIATTWKGWGRYHHHRADTWCGIEIKDTSEATGAKIHISVGGGGSACAKQRGKNLSLELKYKLDAWAHGTGSQEAKSLHGIAAYDGKLTPGEDLVFLGHLGAAPEADYHYIVIWRAARLQG